MKEEFFVKRPIELYSYNVEGGKRILEMEHHFGTVTACNRFDNNSKSLYKAHIVAQSYPNSLPPLNQEFFILLRDFGAFI